MILIRTIIFSLLLMLITTSCQNEVLIGKPLISFNFNNNLNNKGLAKVALYGPQSVSYSYEKKDTCLDLSLHAVNRNPLSLKFKENFSINDYEGFTLALRVKKYPHDNHEYVILSQEKSDSIGVNGWRLITQSNGAWAWQLRDATNEWSYRPTNKQTIADGNWHHLVFSYDAKKQEVRLYYDGKNVAVYSVWENQMNLDGLPINIGVSSLTAQVKENLFNGLLDDLAMWPRLLNEHEIQSLYREKGNKKHKSPNIDEKLSVMTWNIWDGGIHDGKYVGVSRVVDVLKTHQPDVVILQEVNNSGAIIADALDYTLYYRSSNVNLLCAYPLGESHNIYRSDNLACIEVLLNDNEKIIACPVSLSDTIRWDSYIFTGNAKQDSIILYEEQTHGKEMRFILSELGQLSLRADDVPIIFAGDLNSGSHLDWTEKNRSNYHDLVVEYPATQKVEESGFIDSYRQINPDETMFLGQTRSLRFDSIVPNRTDYIFYKGQKLDPLSSEVINDHSMGFPSDHAAVFTTFMWN